MIQNLGNCKQNFLNTRYVYKCSGLSNDGFFTFKIVSYLNISNLSELSKPSLNLLNRDNKHNPKTEANCKRETGAFSC